MVARIKTNDTVVVLSGKDKGVQGTVLEVDTAADKVLVKGVSVITRHAKARKQGEVGGIKKQESYIDAAKVMPICPSCKKPCRITTKSAGDAGRRVRACGRCQETL